MSTEHNCYVTIDNTRNTYDLVLQSITYQHGTFRPALTPGQTTVAAGAMFSLSIDASASGHGADGTLVWTTGPSSDRATVTMNFQNVLAGDNVVELTVTGSPAARMAYGGVSYFEAAAGTPEPPLMRDYLPGIGSPAPLHVTFHVVRNSFVDNPASFLPGIKHVVMLMLENRSLDHLMGQLYTSPPPVVFPAGSSPAFEGLGESPTFSNTDSKGNRVTASALNVSLDPDTPDPDPGEDWENVNMQVFFPGTPSDPPTMGGFLQNYEAQGPSPSAAAQIMKFYTPADLPVISGLARSYAVSDAWFCSVPTQTYANRAFSIAGTSAGNVDNFENLHVLLPFQMRTMFNVLADSGDGDWAIYYQDGWLTGDCFTTYQFSRIGSDPNVDEPTQVLPFSNFLQAAQQGTLPAFSYVEPAWYGGTATDPLDGWNGNDYHPPGNIAPGESMLSSVYQALTSNAAAWAKTLLIVTFDEHGGTFDHVPPPATIAPDAQVSSKGFDFTRLGIRVPTLLVSPLIQSGTVFRSPTRVPFDHTSFIRTILGWRGIDVSGGVMGARAAQAPDFLGVLSPSPVNSAVRALAPKAAAPRTEAAGVDRPLNGLQKAMLGALSYSVTGGERGGAEHRRVHEEMSPLKTLGELREYVEKARSARAAKTT